ncbi:MAG: hypothetical protein NVV62_10660 [Terricaulis sp.]|nr:hypothetical protein [Terricaulis sp.]
MALTTDERQSVVDQIAEILLHDVFEELHVYYAESLAATERHVEQANRELRDGVTHLGRALMADDASTAQVQIGKARDHIERAKRDCLKTTIAYADQRLVHMFHEVRVQRGRVDQEFIIARRNLRKQRQAVYKSESRGENDVTTRLLAMTNSFAELETKVIAEYDLPDKRLPWFRHPFRHVRSLWFRFMLPFLVGVCISLVAGLILILVIPDPAGFSASVRAIFGLAQ